MYDCIITDKNENFEYCSSGDRTVGDSFSECVYFLCDINELDITKKFKFKKKNQFLPVCDELPQPHLATFSFRHLWLPLPPEFEQLQFV